MVRKRRKSHKKAKPGEIRLSYGMVEGEYDIAVSWNEVPKPDSRLVMQHFTQDRIRPNYINKTFEIEPSFLKELDRRGYDIESIMFSIMKKGEVK